MLTTECYRVGADQDSPAFDRFGVASVHETQKMAVAQLLHHPAATSLQVQLQPDYRLCGQFIGHPGSVKYTAIVHDGGTDQSTLTDTVKPPPPGTATPTPTPVPILGG